MNIYTIIRNAIPDAKESVCEHILWGRTPYPFAALSAKDIYKAAYRWKRACDHGLDLCDYCDKLATDGYLCDSCRNAITISKE